MKILYYCKELRIIYMIAVYFLHFLVLVMEKIIITMPNHIFKLTPFLTHFSSQNIDHLHLLFCFFEGVQEVGKEANLLFCTFS